MKKRFYYTYYFNKAKYTICLERGIVKKEIESAIQSYIYKYNICREKECIIDYNQSIGIEFNIVDITDDEYSIEVHNIFINN